MVAFLRPAFPDECGTPFGQIKIGREQDILVARFQEGQGCGVARLNEIHDPIEPRLKAFPRFHYDRVLDHYGTHATHQMI